jgi:5-formyltetrahydrofolate cyclo-ligase
LKGAFRRHALASRESLPDNDEKSCMICARFASLGDFSAAGTVMLYVHMRSEVRTQPFVAVALAGGKRVVVPFCVGGELELFHLENMGELEIGTFGILEPAAELRTLSAKRVRPDQIDLVMVPGVAFDRHGGRLGYGKGHYDRLLPRLRPDAIAVGVAFECQLLPEVPMLEYDVFLDKVITEQAVYAGRGRGRE